MAFHEKPALSDDSLPLDQFLTFRLSKVQSKLNAQAIRILRQEAGLTLCHCSDAVPKAIHEPADAADGETKAHSQQAVSACRCASPRARDTQRRRPQGYLLEPHCAAHTSMLGVYSSWH